MSKYVKGIKCTGIYGRFDMDLELEPGVNIVYGKNGAGKTTLVHLLANTLNGAFSRFAFLDFDFAEVHLDDTTVAVERRVAKGGDEIVVTVGGAVIHEAPVEVLGDMKPSARNSIRFASSFVFERAKRILDSTEPSQREDVFERLIRYMPELSSTELEALLHSSGQMVADAEGILPAAYFPAFRTMIDAWASAAQEREAKSPPGRWTAAATRSARRWFGEFVPSVNFPSLLDIEKRLAAEIEQARRNVWRADREYPSQAFLEIFASLSEGPAGFRQQPESILSEIKTLFDRLEDSPLHEESTLVTKVYSQLRESIYELGLQQESEATALRILGVYRDLLQKMVDVQERSFADIQRYLESVNEFLEGKRLTVDPSVRRDEPGAVGLTFHDGTLMPGLRALSSGERQIVTLLYAASHMSEQQVVLIDEPEISLHVDWQRDLLSKMSDQIGGRQIIACTHSPVIAADYDDRQCNLVLTPTKRHGVDEGRGPLGEDMD